jgi:hypothetical protein
MCSLTIHRMRGASTALEYTGKVIFTADLADRFGFKQDDGVPSVWLTLVVKTLVVKTLVVKQDDGVPSVWLTCV